MQNDKANSSQSGTIRTMVSWVVLLFFHPAVLLAQTDYQIIGTWYAYQQKIEISEEGCLFREQLYACKNQNNHILLTTPQGEVIRIQYKLIGDELHLQTRGFSLVLYRDEYAVPNVAIPFQIPTSD